MAGVDWPKREEVVCGVELPNREGVVPDCPKIEEDAGDWPNAGVEDPKREGVLLGWPNAGVLAAGVWPKSEEVAGAV